MYFTPYINLKPARHGPKKLKIQNISKSKSQKTKNHTK